MEPYGYPSERLIEFTNEEHYSYGGLRDWKASQYMLRTAIVYSQKTSSIGRNYLLEQKIKDDPNGLDDWF